MATKKKAPAKKSAAKKASAKKAAPTAKKAASKQRASKSAAKSSGSKKAASTKSPAKKKAPAKKAAATTTKSTKSPFSAAFLKSQRQALLDERGRYTQHAEFLQAEADQLAREREPGDVQFDEESGEGDSIAVERDRDLQLSAQARAAIEEIDAALGRLDDGTYGICVVSGLPIPQERLEAIPHADMRVEYKSRGAAWR